MSPKAGWILQEEVVPRLRSTIPRAVSFIGCEDAEELIADATVIAARMIISAETSRKQFGGSTVEAIYGTPVRDIFADLYQQVEKEVAGRANILRHRKTGKLSQVRQEAITNLVSKLNT